MKGRFEGIDADVWEQELAGEGAVQRLFVLTRRRFRELERSEKLSQQQLADRMGLTRSQVSRWFSSPSNMTLRSAAKILMAMGRQLELGVSDPFAAMRATDEGVEDAPTERMPATVVQLASARPALKYFAMAADAGDAVSAAKPVDQHEPPVAIGEAAGPAGIAMFWSWRSAVLVALPAGVYATSLRLGARHCDILPANDGRYFAATLSVADAAIFVGDNQQDREKFPVEWR